MHKGCGKSNVMGRRRQPRLTGILPVRIWGTDCEGKPFIEHVCTIDISNKGACLAAVRARLSRGDMLGLQYRNRQARFRVIWVSPASTPGDNHVGLECLQPEKELWPVTAPTDGCDNYVPAEARLPEHHKAHSLHENRRSHTRYPVVGKAYVSKIHGGEGFWTIMGDISVSGCYLQRGDPLPVGRNIWLSIKIADAEFQAAGIVRSRHPRMAKGVEFTFMSNADRRTLNRLIAELRELDNTSSISRAPVAAASRLQGRAITPVNRD